MITSNRRLSAQLNAGYCEDMLCTLTVENHTGRASKSKNLAEMKILAEGIIDSCLHHEITNLARINPETGKSAAPYVPGFASLVRFLYRKCRSPENVESNLLPILMENRKLIVLGAPEYFEYNLAARSINQIANSEACKAEQDIFIFLGIDQHTDQVTDARKPLNYNSRYALFELPSLFINILSSGHDATTPAFEKSPSICLVDHMLPLAERLSTLSNVLTNQPIPEELSSGSPELTSRKNQPYTNASAEKFVKEILIPRVVEQDKDVVLTGHSFGGAQVIAVRNAFINILTNHPSNKYNKRKIQAYLNKITFNSIGLSVHESIYPGYACRQNSVVHPCDMIPPTSSKVMVALGMANDKYIVWSEDNNRRNLFVIPPSFSTHNQHNKDGAPEFNFLGHRLACLANSLWDSIVGVQILNNLTSPRQVGVNGDIIRINSKNIRKPGSLNCKVIVKNWLAQLHGEAAHFIKRQRHHPVSGRSDPTIVQQLEIDSAFKRIMISFLKLKESSQQPAKLPWNTNFYHVKMWRQKLRIESVRSGS